ncbi:hypothetical protein [Dactylosporangium sp. NPDC049140]|uniref:hypothetical protein n=1 Tax=Dactylosporangium sp. NPDC049140 TaxID=3155647 RepID=UPI0033D5731D
MLTAAVTAALLSGCTPAGPTRSGSGESAPLRGFGVAVDAAIAGRVPLVHLRVCGAWGCHEQDVTLAPSGTMSAMPCPPTGDPGAACGAVQIPGPGPGYGYAPVPGLTMDPVTVTVTTPPGAPLAVDASAPVRPRPVCPGPGSACADPTPQAEVRIAADGSLSQSR